jgi:hypothetical protein
MDDLLNHDQSSFYDENGDVILHKDIDRKRQLDAYTHIPSDSNVLELKPQYGILSCLVNRRLKNRRSHVVVEFDHQYTKALIMNRDNNNCRFQVSNKILSETTLKEIESIYSLRFDVLLTDCEESILPLIQEDLSNFKFILLGNLKNHTLVESHLTQSGFICLRNESRIIYVNSNILSFDVLSYNTAHGDIGLFGKLGHISSTTDVVTDGSEFCSISLHAPSHLHIKTHKELLIRGYASLTAQECPTFYFKVNDQIIGEVRNAGDKTDPMRLPPGEYKLDISSSTIVWAHSIWLFQIPKEIIYTDLKYFRIDTCISGNGFIKQFNNLINGLILSHSAKRHIYNPRFFLNNMTDWITLSSIFDIEYLNQLLSSLNLDVRVIVDENIGKQEWIQPEYYNNICSPHRRSINQILDKLLNEEYGYINIGDVSSSLIEKDTYTEEIENKLYTNIRFMPNFYIAFNYIRDKTLGEKYNVIHLRLEDDFISHYSKYFKRSYEEYTLLLVCRYLELIEKIFSRKEKVYIITHLSKASYPNNYVMNVLCKKYPNIILPVNWRDHIDLPLGEK